MKLVINVDEYKIESCKRRKKEGWNEWYHNMILEGKPFNDELVKELEKIKREMILQRDSVDLFQSAFDWNIELIEKRITELKGESR